jgi:hypothetical protein
MKESYMKESCMTAVKQVTAGRAAENRKSKGERES